MTLVRANPTTRALLACKGALLATAAVLLPPRAAHAQQRAPELLERLSLRGELGVGSMLPEHQRDVLRFGLAIQGSLRAAFSVTDLVAAQLVVSNWGFPSDLGGGQVVQLAPGVRFEPRLGPGGRLFVDAAAGVGITGGLARFAFDLGAGYEHPLSSWISAGPALRYGHLVAGSNVGGDAQYWSAGLSLTVRMPAPESAPLAGATGSVARPVPSPEDGDRDGVPDREDLCPTRPAGDRADPSRRGCPADDADGDGVLDGGDQCVTTPQGEHPDPDRPGCPDGDNDNDGVLNHVDQCPAQPPGVHLDPARPGCPAPDADGDTVPDQSDACPDRPGAPHPVARRNGCPGLVRVEADQIVINRPVFFANNSDRILPRSHAVLGAVADALRALPEVRRLSVEGHTDDVGDDAANLQLSERRAQSVRAWLIQRGIEADRLEAHGYGESRPLAPNETREGRAQNRRVEFRIVSPAHPAGAAPAAPAP